MNPGDRIFGDGDRWLLPIEPASVPGFVKHVYCDGSRDHVLNYEGWTSRKTFETICVEHCSVPNCIVNHERAERLWEHGLPCPAENSLSGRQGHTSAGTLPPADPNPPPPHPIGNGEAGGGE